MSKKKNSTEDVDDVMNEEYKNYYNDILQQMKNQGFSKVQIAVQKMMYQKREDLYEEFLDRYEFENAIIEFIPEK